MTKNCFWTLAQQEPYNNNVININNNNNDYKYK